MKVSVNEEYFRFRPDGTRRDQKENIKMLAKAGFEAIDFGLGALKKGSGIATCDDYKDKAVQMREFCEGVGISVNQAHAPFYEASPMPEGFAETLPKVVETSAILGADCVVVHADTWYEGPGAEFDFDRALNAIYEVYAPAVEVAERVGVKIAMETLFCWNPKWHRFCSRREELDTIVSKFNTDAVGICLDTGHWNVSYCGDGMFDEIKHLKNKIIATHIHDNKAKTDDHMLPYTGVTNWDRFCSTMKQIGYEGDVTLELVYGAFPDELVFDAMVFARSIADRLRSGIIGG